MPYKDKAAKKSYMRDYMKIRMRTIRQGAKDLKKWKSIMVLINNEFKEKALIPIHIYNWKPIMMQMIREHFGKRMYRVRRQTELITMSIKECVRSDG